MRSFNEGKCKLVYLVYAKQECKQYCSGRVCVLWCRVGGWPVPSVSARAHPPFSRFSRDLLQIARMVCKNPNVFMLFKS